MVKLGILSILNRDDKKWSIWKNNEFDHEK